MMAYIFFLAFAFSVPALFWYWKKKHSLEDEPLEGIEGLADTDIVCVPFKSEWITMSKIEYLNRWSNMNRSQKSDVLENQKKMIKQGKVSKHFFDGGKYQILPTEKGKMFEKLHNIKEEMYRGNA